MKTFYLILFVFVITISHSIAQVVPAGFNYQAVVRDAAGSLKKGSIVNLRFTLQAGQFDSNPAWIETHNTKTDSLGICTVVIGAGTKTGGTSPTFAEIDFGSANFWLKIELQEGSQYVPLGGAQQLLSVPYARVAAKIVSDSPQMPIGTILAFAGDINKIPTGWLLCDGSQVSRSTYAGLYNIIGTGWGRGDNATTFHLPDLRGRFLRGVDGNSNRDIDKEARTASNEGGNIGSNVGSIQTDVFKNHNHGGGDHSHSWQGASTIDTWGGNVVVGGNGIGQKNTPPSGAIIAAEGGSETRPINAYVFYIIKI
ncbi:phage tail protein [Rufibacter latericius]|uniref:Phage tail collar domain-containing protein n=1 Tax=Rufibacter latericius TaxID=2487040 RepID=A0A3M9M907_9BACT|nr:phage tail protein [Rufibacter latericius]RNI22060.1 hypothetical protein EFB08_21735 [Rufibacter latericius]